MYGHLFPHHHVGVIPAGLDPPRRRFHSDVNQGFGPGNVSPSGAPACVQLVSVLTFYYLIFEGSNTSRPDIPSSTGGPCPPGTYCVNGSSLPVNCDAGTYNPISVQDACLDCPPGYYCVNGASIAQDCPTGKL